MMPMSAEERLDTAIEAAADSLLAVCALQTGTDPKLAAMRAVEAITAVYERAESESRR
jgi:hypothetical protein